MGWRFGKKRKSDPTESPPNKPTFLLWMPVWVALIAGLLSLAGSLYLRLQGRGHVVLESVYTEAADQNYADHVVGGFKLHEVRETHLDKFRNPAKTDDVDQAAAQAQAQAPPPSASCQDLWDTWKAARQNAGKPGGEGRYIVEGTYEHPADGTLRFNTAPNSLGVSYYAVAPDLEDQPPAPLVESGTCEQTLARLAAGGGSVGKDMQFKPHVLSVVIRNAGGRDITITGYETKVHFADSFGAAHGGYTRRAATPMPATLKVDTKHPVAETFAEPIGLESGKSVLAKYNVLYRIPYTGDGEVFMYYSISLNYFDGERNQSMLVGNFYATGLASCVKDWGTAPEGCLPENSLAVSALGNAQ